MADLSFGVIVLNDKDEILFKKNKMSPKYSLPEEKASSDMKIKDAIPNKMKQDAGIDVDILEFFAIRQEKGMHLIFITKAKSDISKDKKREFRWVEVKKAIELELPETSKIALEAFYKKKGL